MISAMAVQMLHEFFAFYLVLTLSATGIAKARNWREASIVVASERLIPRRLAATSIAAVTTVELLLATLVATRFMPRVVGAVVATMFLVFGGYKLIAGLKRGILGCACAGSQTVYKATVPGVVATCLASLIQAAVAFVYAFTPPVSGSLLLDTLLLGALALPITMYLCRALGDAREIKASRLTSAA